MRLIPRQCSDSHQPAWGVLFQGRLYRWASFDLAYIGAVICLGVPPGDIAPVVVLRATTDDTWAA